MNISFEKFIKNLLVVVVVVKVAEKELMADDFGRYKIAKTNIPIPMRKNMEHIRQMYILIRRVRE